MLEHPGPYPRVAADALGPEGERLRGVLRDAGIGLLLARRSRRVPGGADARGPGGAARSRRAWFALGGRMVAWDDLDPTTLADRDWTSLSPENAVPPAIPASDPVLFVCTNGKRDACCALLGRPVAETLKLEGMPVWECSHIGGHRFAATALLLPFGTVHGRLHAATARDLLESARDGRLHLPSLRGFSELPEDAQAADIAVRESESIGGLVRMTVTSEGTQTRRDCEVGHPDGRRWRVRLTRGEGPPRPESCGREPTSSEYWQVEHVERT